VYESILILKVVFGTI